MITPEYMESIGDTLVSLGYTQHKDFKTCYSIGMFGKYFKYYVKLHYTYTVIFINGDQSNPPIVDTDEKAILEKLAKLGEKCAKQEIRKRRIARINI